MVIPSLINAYQKHITVTRLKQTYAQLSQAIKLSEADNGDIDTWNMSSQETLNVDEGKRFAETYIVPYMKYSHACIGSKPGCNTYSIRNLKGIVDNRDYFKLYAIILVNGVKIVFNSYKDYAYISIDINGPSMPNVVGKDIFFVVLKKSIIPNFVSTVRVDIEQSGLYFAGEGNTREQLKLGPEGCAKTGLHAGTHCGALIKLDGWKISKDYPW